MSDQTNHSQPVQEEPSLSELLQIRREKLAELQNACLLYTSRCV